MPKAGKLLPRAKQKSFYLSEYSFVFLAEKNKEEKNKENRKLLCIYTIILQSAASHCKPKLSLNKDIHSFSAFSVIEGNVNHEMLQDRQSST